SRCCLAAQLFFCRSCFFLIITLPPRSTLFPYMTLFRSFLRRRGCPRFLCGEDWVVGIASGFATEEAAGIGRRKRPAVAQALGQVDRKSTRLNSSHVKISYAVFCLKKKIAHCVIMTVHTG